MQSRQEQDRYTHALINSSASERIALETIRTLGNQAYQNNISTLVFFNYCSEAVVLRVHRAIRLLQAYGIVRSKDGLWYIANQEYRPDFAIETHGIEGIKVGGIVPELATGQRTCFKCDCILTDHSKANIHRFKGILHLCCEDCSGDIQYQHSRNAASQKSLQRQERKGPPTKTRLVERDAVCSKCGKRGNKTVFEKGGSTYLYYFHYNPTTRCYCGKLS